MRLHDIESAVLLPRFAHNAEWEQKALDQVVKGVRAKSFAMGAPYTRKAIAALSDAELQAFYFQYGIAIYYPDLSRETRENMLFELARVYRSLGTPHSVELLCEYIFDGADKVRVEIHDNLAFNAAGELVDDSLLDLFDVDLFPTSPTLSQDKIERIVENIFRFCRNSQTLRDIIIEFPDVAELPIASCDLEAFVYTIGGDEIAQPAAPPVPLGDFILVDSLGNVVYSVENLTEIEFTPTGYFTIDEGNEVIFVEQSPFPVVCIDEGTRTPESIAPDDSFDTELPYYPSKLYIVTTDDGQDETLYGWEAEEGTPVVALPEVSAGGNFGTNNWLYRTNGGSVMSIAANSQENLWNATGSGYVNVSYDTSKVYAVILWYSGTGSGDKGQNGVLSVVNNSGDIAAKNNTSSSVNLYALRCAVCSDSTATVVTVYDSSLVPYNAFKYTAGGTDYYYVLDGVQTDWTDDLSSIGYSLMPQTLEIVLALRYDPSTSQWKTVAFDQTPSATENYWWGCVINQEDAAALQVLGLTYHDPSSIWGGSKFTGPIGNVVYNSGYSYEVIALYSDMGTTEVAQSLLPSLTLEPLNRDNTDLLTIWSKNVIDTTPVKTWKVRITKL